MNEKELVATWKQEEGKPFTGWDFSYLNGRWMVEQPPWDYFARAVELMQRCSSVVDMGTGGGEELLRLKGHWPKKVTATEAYPPNLKLAAKRLRPFARLALITARPPRVFMRTKKPCVLDLRVFEGWYVLFMVFSYSNWTLPINRET